MRFRGWFELSSCLFPGKARKKVSLGKENLLANERISEINRVERLYEEIRGLMNVPVEETNNN